SARFGLEHPFGGQNRLIHEATGVEVPPVTRLENCFRNSADRCMHLNGVEFRNRRAGGKQVLDPLYDSSKVNAAKQLDVLENVSGIEITGSKLRDVSSNWASAARQSADPKVWRDHSARLIRRKTNWRL